MEFPRWSPIQKVAGLDMLNSCKVAVLQTDHALTTASSGSGDRYKILLLLFPFY